MGLRVGIDLIKHDQCMQSVINYYYIGTFRGLDALQDFHLLAMSSTLKQPCVSVPPEIWCLILSSLQPHTLTQVAQVSPSFQSLSLPILYRAVHLCSDSEAIKSTFDLLKDAHSLRENIRELHLGSSWKDCEKQPDVWLDLNVLALLPGLRMLTLAGLPYHTAQENVAFVKALSSSCSLLEELIFLEDPSADWALDEDGDVKEWPVSHPLYFTEIFNKCRMSVTRIAMILTSGNNSIASSLPFSISHFPRLTSLELGPCLDDLEDDCGRVLTQFLVAHPLLEHLSLNFSVENTIMVELCETSIIPDMLPRLRSLRASVGNVLRLARNGVRSLRTHLSKLYILHDQTMVHEAIAMLRALENLGGLPGLNELCYELDIEQELEQRRICKHAMFQTGRIFPGLRRLTESISVMEVEDIPAIFSAFPKITHFSCPLLRGTKETHGVIVSALASTCSDLVEVSFGLDCDNYMHFCVRNGSVLKTSVIPGQLGF